MLRCSVFSSVEFLVFANGTAYDTRIGNLLPRFTPNDLSVSTRKVDILINDSPNLLINSSSSSKEITKSNVKAHVGMISMLDSKTNLTDNSFYLINGAEEGFAYYYNNGVMLKSKVTLSRSIKPVIAIKNSILKSGKGTSEDPYVMEG